MSEDQELKTAKGVVVTDFECPHCGEPDALQGIVGGEVECHTCKKEFAIVRNDHLG